MSASLSFDSHWLWIPVIALVFLTLSVSTAYAEGLSEDIKALMGIPFDAEPEFKLVATSPNKSFTPEQVAANAPDIISLEAAHIGFDRHLFRVRFGHPIRFDEGSLLHFYLYKDQNLETGRQDTPAHRGVDVMVTLSEGNVGLRSLNPNYSVGRMFAGGTVVDDTLYAVLEAPLHGDEKTIRFTVHLLAERYQGGRKIGQTDATSRQSVELPRQTVSRLVPLDRLRLTSLTPLTAYRYMDDKVKYETLENKGLPYRAVAANESFSFGRQRPTVPFSYDVRRPGKAGDIARRQVEVEILEEAGVARDEVPVTFGFPLPLGGVYDLEHVRLLSAAGEEISAQFAATSYWPDDSLKWILVDFSDRLDAGERKVYTLEFGNEVRRQTVGTGRGVVIEEDDQALFITTGPLQARIAKTSFKLFDGVWIDADGDGDFAEDELVAVSGAEGVALVDEHGKLFTTSARPPESIRIEESGDEKVVIRVEGKYSSDDGEQHMRYVTRLTFRAGSTRVNIAHTHINDYLETEFTDITSMNIPIALSPPIRQAEVFTGEQQDGLRAHSADGAALRLFQSDENTVTVNGQIVARRASWTPGLSPGVVRVNDGKRSVTAVIHDFQERWPKGLAAEGNRLSLELFPEQPDSEYGSNLPYHLMFPFVSGKYRLKWGNSFTDRITVDFAGRATPEDMAAEGRLPVVAVIPAHWYNETGVLGPIAVSIGERTAVWNDFVQGSYLEHMNKKAQAREYGYFNYGDWFGERGRNWGNNEYDLAHGFFMEFVRTGDRRYYRLALAAARHQADVDIIHAYPDPTFIGANAQHSVGHTGAWSQLLAQATWSKAFDASFKASNGHTWAGGMMDAWYLTGDARVMESALALGEHIAWAMAPEFNALGTHERSAGWSVKALMALYRGTYDPVYLDAAWRIVSVALRQQDLDGSGAWPHPLPADHSGSKPDAVGNNLFLIGVLLSGLQSYHAETGDPDVLTSLEAAVQWVLKSWNPQRRGWPYSAETDGTPLYEASTGLNTLVIPAIAYVGALRHDDHLMEIVDSALMTHVRAGLRGDGKAIAQSLHFTSEVLARLNEWKNPLWINFAGEIKESAVVLGSVPLGIQILSETPENVERLQLVLDGEPIFTGTDLHALEDYVLDTLELADGRHDLTVIVDDRLQGKITKGIWFRVRNWWTLDDRLQAPIMAFGFPLERLLAEDKSEGWEHAEDRPELFFDDPDRLTRSAPTEEYLIWPTPLLQEVEVVLYARSDDVQGGVILAVSEDGVDWQHVSYRSEVIGRSPEGWRQLRLRYVVDSAITVNWLRLTFTETLPSEVQLGNVSMKGLRSE